MVDDLMIMLRPILTEYIANLRPTKDKVVGTVARHLDMTVVELKTDHSTHRHSTARHLCYWILTDRFAMSTREISLHMEVAQSGVIQGLTSIRNRFATDAKFRDWVTNFLKINGLTANNKGEII